MAPVTHVYDGQIIDFTGSTVYWTNEEMGRTGQTEFDIRKGELKTFVELHEPYAATSGITWSDCIQNASLLVALFKDDNIATLGVQSMVNLSGYTNNDPSVISTTPLQQSVTVSVNFTGNTASHNDVALTTNIIISSGNTGAIDEPYLYFDGVDWETIIEITLFEIVDLVTSE